MGSGSQKSANVVGSNSFHVASQIVGLDQNYILAESIFSVMDATLKQGHVCFFICYFYVDPKRCIWVEELLDGMISFMSAMQDARCQLDITVILVQLNTWFNSRYIQRMPILSCLNPCGFIF